jgi:uncharacterized protein YciI
MKSITLFSIMAITGLFLLACKPKVNVETTSMEGTTDEFAYDSTLAAQLGADEYGMRKYVMAFLKAGPNRDQDSITAVELQRAHMANINRMADEGKLAVAGPFLDGGELKGIYIFNVSTIEEAKALTETDPAIKAGRLVMELHPWYGSAATMMVNDWHKKVQKKAF